MPIAQEMKNLTEDIAVSYGERMSFLGGLEKDTHQMIDRFGKERKTMAKDLSAFLGNSESTRISNFKGTMSEIEVRLSAIRAGEGERRKEVASLLNRLEDELSAMAAELQAFLGKSEKRRLEEFRQMLSDIKAKQRAREKEVAELLDASRKDIGEARAAWQNLAKILVSKRGGKKAPIAEVPKRVEEAAERAFAEGELKVKALALVEERPEGISLEKLGKKLGVSRIRLARPINELQGEGKVIKRDKLYLPASVGA